MGRIEQAQPKPRLEEAGDRGVDFRLGDEALLDRAGEAVVIRAATEVAAGFDGARGGLLGRGHDFVVGEDVIDRAAVGDHVPVKAPLPAQQFGQQERIRAGGLAVDAVVGAHDGAHMAFANRGLKVGQVGFVEIALGRRGIEAMALGSGPLWTAKCFAQAMALMYFGSSPCNPRMNATASRAVRNGSSP